jgi:hypothetical protein
VYSDPVLRGLALEQEVFTWPAGPKLSQAMRPLPR